MKIRVTVADKVKKQIDVIQPQFARRHWMKMVYNQADFIKAAIDEGFIVEAIVLVSAVVVCS
ncbi:hypothetical protein O9992_29635 [Vibrio lentus]|nr:hypothetical protein [Vibrio lentus]